MMQYCCAPHGEYGLEWIYGDSQTIYVELEKKFKKFSKSFDDFTDGAICIM